MKIDLHIHTIGAKEREISNEDLITKLSQADVRLASITDHNLVDVNKFKSLEKNNSGIKFIPGIEVDVIFESNDKKHFTVISEDIDIVKRFENETEGILWSNFKQMLAEINKTTLISAHFMKHENRSFTDINILDKLLHQINSSFIKKMIDLPSENKAMDIQAHVQRRYHVASFSDVRDWRKYLDKAHSLPFTTYDVNSLESYIKNFVDTCHQFGIDSEEESKTYQFILSKDKREIEIDLPRGLNIVFGNKGSGKSEFINSFLLSNVGEFQKLVFKNITSENLMDLYKQYKGDGILSTSQTTMLTKFANLLNQPFETEKIVGKDAISAFDAFYKNLKKSVNWNTLNIIVKENIFLSNKYEDSSTLTLQQIKCMQTICLNLYVVLEVVMHEDYSGSIEREEVESLIVKNFDDWQKSIKLNKFSMRTRMLNDLKIKLKLETEPKLFLNDIVLKYISNIRAKNNFISEFINIKSQINESDTLFSTDILGEVYVYKTKLIKRTNDSSSSDDFEEIASAKDFSLKKDQIPMLLDTKELLDILNFQFTFDSFKVGDIFNIVFISNFLGDDVYIPSTGQYDMMKLDYFLRRNCNLVMDEFCNSLDSEYVFKFLVDKMNRYGGTILATTHNPIISVIPKIGRYIYRLRHGKNYKTFFSNNSIYGDLISLDGKEKINAKRQIIDTIEGTMEAFDKRKEKYES